MGNKKDSLGDRMKSFYEDRFRIMLPRRTYTLIRIDGKAFHSYTKGMVRPFDDKLINAMNATTKFLCENIQGCNLGYVQSDEITLVLTDFEERETQAWFDGNLQKMCSISASLATAVFNSFGLKPGVFAMFDSRVFQVSHKSEVMNCLVWRQQDATRNSISAVAQSLYSAKELHKKSTNEMQEMIFKKGINWNDYDAGLKRGRCVIKREVQKNGVTRNKWIVENPPIFTENDKEWLNSVIK